MVHIVDIGDKANGYHGYRSHVFLVQCTVLIKCDNAESDLVLSPQPLLSCLILSNTCNYLVSHLYKNGQSLLFSSLVTKH